MKKIVALLICVLLVAALAIPAFAADTSPSITISADKATAAKGETITFTIVASNLGEVKGVGAIPEFDTNVFKLVGGTGNASVFTSVDPNPIFYFPIVGFDPTKGFFATFNYVSKLVDTSCVIGSFTLEVIADCGADNVTANANLNGTPISVNQISVAVDGEHDFGAWAPNGDNHIHTCSKCGAEETGEHKWEGTVGKVPNCTEEGYASLWCEICQATGSETLEVNPDAHSWDDGQITTEPKCGVEGVKTYTCQHNAAHTKTEAIPALEHSFEGNWVTHKETSCVEPGEKRDYCANGCGEYQSEAIPATGHSWGEWTVVTDSTCTTVGEERRDCSVCDHFETREIAKKDHDYANAVVTAPTCTEKGYTTRTCVCGESKVDTYVNPTGHKYEKNWQIEVAPTCTEKGEERDYCANGCGEYKKQSVKATGHTYDEGVITTAPECEKKGVKTFTCTHCDHSYTESVPAAGHTPAADAEVTKAPTCTEKGEMSGKCDVCGKVLEEQEIPALGHEWGEWTVTTPATCTAKGVETRECATCHETETKSIDKIAHDLEAVVTAPTCTEKGFTTYNCKNCDHSEKGEYVKATGHKYEGNWQVVVAPTCEEKGEEHDYCANGCGEFKKQSVPATGHTPAADAEVTKAPTCEEKGEMSGKCDVCGKVLEKQEIPALGHDYELTEDVAPNCTEKGHKTYVCKNDATHTYTEEFDALGHTYGDWIQVDAENHKHVCTVADCGHEETVAHNWDSGKVMIQPCTVNGLKVYTCKDCGATREEVLPADDKHDYDASAEVIIGEDGEVDKNNHTAHCSCGEVTVEKHSYDIWGDVIKEPTSTTKGEQEKLCACGEKIVVKIKANGVLDGEPANGDITGQVVMTGVAAFSMLAAAAYVFTRKRTA